MNLYDKKFVHFEWEDKLEGKEGFFADSAEDLKYRVNNCCGYKNNVLESGDERYPFSDGNESNWRFFYYDPNYKCKRAYAKGKAIQIKFEDIWLNISTPNWEESSEYRIKPEEPKSRRMTYRELAEWLAKGNGQYMLETNIIYNVVTAYDLPRDNVEIGKEYKIRRWGSDEWIEPTVDEFNKDFRHEGLSKGE